MGVRKIVYILKSTTFPRISEEVHIYDSSNKHDKRLDILQDCEYGIGNLDSKQLYMVKQLERTGY